MNISRKHLYIIAFCALFSSRAAAQPTDTLLYRSQLVRSAGAGFPALNYALLSPLNHHGYSINFYSSRLRAKAQHINQFNQQFQIGVLYNQANNSYITQLSFSGGWSRHWPVAGHTSPMSLLVGAATTAGLNIYLKDDNTNNPIAYFFNLSAGPSLMLRYRLNIQKMRVELSQQAHIPIAALISTSGYTSSLPSGLSETEASVFDAMRTASLGRLRKCVTATTLDMIPSPARRAKWPVIRISYIFAGMNYRDGDITVRSVDHLLLVGTVVHLFR